jgi:hypothetical protein
MLLGWTPRKRGWNCKAPAYLGDVLGELCGGVGVNKVGAGGKVVGGERG